MNKKKHSYKSESFEIVSTFSSSAIFESVEPEDIQAIN
jgi:hypothetical protein